MICVSVIVPVYNVSKYLSRCLDSLVAQSLKDFEVILVNDGSTDDSLTICESYGNKYMQLFKIYSKPNGGLSDARNFGIKRAQGAYLAFIDSDDWIDSRMLEDMYQRALQTQADIVACDLEYHHEDGNTAFSSGGVFDVVLVQERPEIMTINNSACNKIYKKELFETIEFPVGLWYEDLATIPRLILSATKIAKIDQPFYKYYQRSGSIMHSSTKKVFDIYKCIDITYAYVKETCDQNVQSKLNDHINDLYLLHGLQLTTLKIREFQTDREEYLKENVAQISSRLPNWYDLTLKQKHPFKMRIVFTLLRYQQFKLLLWFYDLIK